MEVVLQYQILLQIPLVFISPNVVCLPLVVTCASKHLFNTTSPKSTDYW